MMHSVLVARVQHQNYAELDFANKHPIPPPPGDMFGVTYAEVGQT